MLCFRRSEWADGDRSVRSLPSSTVKRDAALRQKFERLSGLSRGGGVRKAVLTYGGEVDFLKFINRAGVYVITKSNSPAKRVWVGLVSICAGIWLL